jgi:hypothetical protein
MAEQACAVLFKVGPLPCRSRPTPLSDMPTQWHRVANWAKSDAALRQQGSLTV